MEEVKYWNETMEEHFKYYFQIAASGGTKKSTPSGLVLPMLPQASLPTLPEIKLPTLPEINLPGIGG